MLLAIYNACCESVSTLELFSLACSLDAGFDSTACGYQGSYKNPARLLVVSQCKSRLFEIAFLVIARSPVDSTAVPPLPSKANLSS